MEDKAAVAERYAKSLFKVIEDPIIISQLKIVASLFGEREGIHDFFDKETIEVDERERWIERELASFIPQVKKLVELLDEKKRIVLLRDIALQYEHLIYEKNDIERIYIKTATPVKPEMTNKIVQHFEKKLQKSLRPVLIVDPEIIGGVTVQVEGILYDDSIQSKLNKIIYDLKKR